MTVRLRTNIAPTPADSNDEKVVRERKSANHAIEAEARVEHFEIEKGRSAGPCHFSGDR